MTVSGFGTDDRATHRSPTRTPVTFHTVADGELMAWSGMSFDTSLGGCSFAPFHVDLEPVVGVRGVACLRLGGPFVIAASVNRCEIGLMALTFDALDERRTRVFQDYIDRSAEMLAETADGLGSVMRAYVFREDGTAEEHGVSWHVAGCTLAVSPDLWEIGEEAMVVGTDGSPYRVVATAALDGMVDFAYT